MKSNDEFPGRRRAEETVAAILEAAAQVLEAGGLAGFTTNAVAERAGVSIGTLYQYFADKEALLRALAEREMRMATIASRHKGVARRAAGSLEVRVRAMVRAIVNAFHGRQRARKAVVQAVLAQGMRDRDGGSRRRLHRRGRIHAPTRHGAPHAASSSSSSRAP